MGALLIALALLGPAKTPCQAFADGYTAARFPYAWVMPPFFPGSLRLIYDAATTGIDQMPISAKAQMALLALRPITADEADAQALSVCHKVFTDGDIRELAWPGNAPGGASG